MEEAHRLLTQLLQLDSSIACKTIGMNTQLIPPSNILERYDNFLFDCDGVLWRGGELIQGTLELIQNLRSLGKKILFITNNSSKSRAKYQQKFAKYGIDVHIEEIISSSFAAAEYLSSEFPQVRKAYVVGQSGIVEELALKGVESSGASEDSQQNVTSEDDCIRIELDPEVGAVICGWDIAFNYYKLCKACFYLKNENCHFIATNLDAYDHVAGRNIPGGGCMVASIQTGSRRTPILVGKPCNWLINRVMLTHDLNRERTVMIGDRLDTDIQFGINGNISTILVLTGTTTVEEAVVNEKEGSSIPTFILP